MLKVKSKTDVITNSSSESFVMKIQDYEEFKEYVKTKMRKYNKDSVLSDLGHFLLINDFSDIKRFSESNRWFRWIMGPQPVSPSVGLKIPRVIRLLKDFGHTEVEINDYFERIDREFWEKVESSGIFKSKFGNAYGYLDHWNSVSEPLTKWMKREKKTFIKHDSD